MEKIINLTKEALEALNNGDYIIIRWDDSLLLKVEKYTLEEQIRDELFGDEPEVVFVPHCQPPKADK